MTLPLFELEEWFAHAEGRFDLSLSHSACQPQDIADFVAPSDWDHFRSLNLAYGPFEGDEELRTEIASGYQSIEPHDVLTFHGPSEVIYTFMRAMLTADDSVVVQTPAYHALRAIAEGIGCEIREWKPIDDRDFRFHIDDLAKQCTPRTKLIVVNFPHNPTGQLIDEQEFRQLVSLADSLDAYLFSDEAFRLLELPPHSTLTAACDLSRNAVSATGMSKPYGLGGLRIGWMATKSDAIRQAVRRYRYYTAEMTNTPCQWLACRALQHKDTVLSANRQLIQENLVRLTDYVSGRSDLFRLLPPQAGTMAVVEQFSSMTSTAFCQQLLDQERLFLIPGQPLGLSDRFLRFGLGMRDFSQALERLSRFLEKLDTLSDSDIRAVTKH